MTDSILLLLIVFSPFLAGIGAYIVKKDWLLAVFSLMILFGMISIATGVILTGENLYVEVPEICGYGLLFEVDGFRGIYATIAAFMWAMVCIFEKEYFLHHENTNRFYMFLLWTLGATLGVFLSGDLITTFIFFEIMSFTSYVWVAQEEKKDALRAAQTYLAVAVLGGLVMLMGIFLLYHRLGTLRIDDLIYVQKFDGYMLAAGICMLFGFGAKAGAFPLHIWLPKAHPVAPAPASALLSGILTKTGIFGILILSCRLFHNFAPWGMLILTIGVITMFGGALLAVFSIDLKRTLACSSMSQIGFILIGVGMQNLLGRENQLALQGTMLHMMNHSLIKLVLFLMAGAIYMKVHALDLNVIRGFGRKKHFYKIVFLVGALAIGGIPGFSGYISKTLLHESIVEYGGGVLFTVVEWIFLISGGMTVAYMTKLFLAIFVEKNADKDLQEKYDAAKSANCIGTYVALAISALVLFVFGAFPHQLMEKAVYFSKSFLGAEFAHLHEVSYFSLENLKGAGISIAIGMLLYFAVIRTLLMKDGKYVNIWPKWFDLENLIYRPVLLSFLPFVFGVICRILDCLVDTIVVMLRKTIYKDSPLPYERLEGTAFTEFFGKICNRFLRNPQKDYVHIFAMQRTALKESGFIIQRSLSFGLLMFCIGLGFVLIVLVF